MSVLNNSLVECLQTTREGKDPTTESPPAKVIDNQRLGPAKYKIKSENDICSSFYITPIDSEDNVRFEMGYQITASGGVTKIATPADDESSFGRCKRWAGPNCGASAEQQAQWLLEAQLAAAESECTDNFSNWLTGPPAGTGNQNRWDPVEKTCTLETWAYSGSIVA